MGLGQYSLPKVSNGFNVGVAGAFNRGRLELILILTGLSLLLSDSIGHLCHKLA